MIAAETHEIVIIRNGRDTAHGFCSECSAEVELFSLDLAVSISGKRAREILALMQTGKIHSLETAYGHLLLCSHSLEGANR